LAPDATPDTESDCILPDMNEEANSARRPTPEQLKDLYRQARDPVLRAHLHIVWRLSLGESLGRVAEMAGYSTKWTKEIARRYEERGVEGLGDRRHRNPGGADRALLDAPQREELREALKHPAPDGGLWSGPKVALWIAAKTGRRRHGVRAQRGWEYLKKLGHTPQVPRPSYAAEEGDSDEQEAFKKSCPSG
jgi:transposase